MSRSLTVITCFLALLVAVGRPAAAESALGSDSATPFEIELRPYESPRAAVAPQQLGTFDVELILDDGVAEGATGANGVTAAQFLWFSQFDSGGQAVDLEVIQVLFPSGDNMAPGNAVQVAIYSDDDGDPTNGATLVATLDETIQATDDATFSVYSVDPALSFDAGQDILIGVVPRFIDTGVTSPTFPAAADTSAPQGRSWVALWSGDPPSSPELPSDGSMVQTNGNWLIRGFGSVGDTGPPVIEVPTMGSTGLLVLFGLLTLAGARLLRRREG